MAVSVTPDITVPCVVVKVYPAVELSSVVLLLTTSEDLTLKRYVVFGVRPVTVTE